MLSWLQVPGMKKIIQQSITAPFNNMRTAQPPQMRFSLPSIKCSVTLPNTDCCRARGNQIVERSSDSETVLGSEKNALVG